MQITVYHNPNCGTSREVLAAIRASGQEPRIVEYLKTPLSRAELEALTRCMAIPPRDLVRTKEPLYAELGLDKPGVGDGEILDAMAAHPVLMNRPIVATAHAAKLCRPSAVVHELLAGRGS